MEVVGFHHFFSEFPQDVNLFAGGGRVGNQGEPGPGEAGQFFSGCRDGLLIRGFSRAPFSDANRMRCQPRRMLEYLRQDETTYGTYSRLSGQRRGSGGDYLVVLDFQAEGTPEWTQDARGLFRLVGSTVPLGEAVCERAGRADVNTRAAEAASRFRVVALKGRSDPGICSAADEIDGRFPV
ncbi:hypothetical protein ES703_77237 [subsurface metagenome]